MDRDASHNDMFPSTVRANYLMLYPWKIGTSKIEFYGFSTYGQVSK